MYHSFQLLKRYLAYYFRSGNSRGHGMHSPFVYQLIREVLIDRKHYDAYAKAEAYRRSLKVDKTKLELVELGAGSVHTSSNFRSVSSIARSAAKPPKFGQLLFRLVRYFKPATILELGTSLGITTAYLQFGRPQARVITLEGSPEIAARAETGFRDLGIRPRLVLGNFDDTLQDVLTDLRQVDFVFVDGNHRREPTLRYFDWLQPALHDEAVLVFDDIHWSPEMEEAWAGIRAHERVRCTVDLFFIGLVFLSPSFLEKRHFEIRF